MDMPSQLSNLPAQFDPSPFFSSTSALFCAMETSQPLSCQSLAHSFPCNGGWGCIQLPNFQNSVHSSKLRMLDALLFLTLTKLPGCGVTLSQIGALTYHPNPQTSHLLFSINSAISALKTHAVRAQSAPHPPTAASRMFSSGPVLPLHPPLRHFIHDLQLKTYNSPRPAQFGGCFSPRTKRRLFPMKTQKQSKPASPGKPSLQAEHIRNGLGPQTKAIHGGEAVRHGVNGPVVTEIVR